MKLIFDKLITSDGKVKISFDNETTWTEYNVEDIKNTGIEFTEEDCPDLTKIRIAGAITKIGDIKTHISNGSFSQDLTADEKVENLNSRFLNFQYDLDNNDENLVDITNEGTDITNNIGVFENTIQKKPNTMIYYKRADKENSTWQKLEETSFDNSMIALYKGIIASRTNGEFIQLGYDTYYNISYYGNYTRDQLINIYNNALENGYETQDEALSRIFDDLAWANQNLTAGIQKLQAVQDYHMNRDDIMTDSNLIKNSYIKAVKDLISRGWTAYNTYNSVILENDTYFTMSFDNDHIGKNAYTYNDDISATVHSLFRISSSTDPYNTIPFKIRLPQLDGITEYFSDNTPQIIVLGILEILKAYLEEENTAIIAWLFKNITNSVINKNIEQFNILQVISEDNQYKIQRLQRVSLESTPMLKYKYIY